MTRWRLFLCLLAAEAPNLAFALSQTEEPGKIPDLRPPEELIPPTFWEQHGGMVVAGAALVVVALSIAVWLLRRPKPALPPVPPEEQARRALGALKDRPEDVALVDEVSRILRSYLQTVFLPGREELTTEEMHAELSRRTGLPPEMLAALRELLKECDARKFAPVPPPAPRGGVSRALDLVDRLEAQRQPAAPSPDVSAPARS